MCLLACLPVLAATLAAEDTELQLVVDVAPQSWRAAAYRGTGDSFANGRDDVHVGGLVDIVVPMPDQGFSESVYPIGGLGFGYAWRAQDDFRDQRLRAKAHFGLAFAPLRGLRFDIQPFLALQGDLLTLPRRMVPAESDRDWFLTGVAYGIEATATARCSSWCAVLARAGVEADYSSVDGQPYVVTLRDQGAVLAAGLVLIQ